MYDAIFVCVITCWGVVYTNRCPFKISWQYGEATCAKENILCCLSNWNKGKVNCCISVCLAVRDICWTTTVMPCYASFAPVFTQIQHGSVSRSDQLLRCMGTRPDAVKVGGGGGGHILSSADFCLAVPKLFTVLPCSPSHLILEYSITKYGVSQKSDRDLNWNSSRSIWPRKSVWIFL